MSDEYYKKDGHLIRKGFFSDEDLGKFEQKWDRTSEVKDVWGNVIATQSEANFFRETDVNIAGEDGKFTEPGFLDRSGNRPFAADPKDVSSGYAAPQSTPSYDDTESSGSSSYGGGFSGTTSSQPTTNSSDELSFWPALLLALLMVSAGALGLHLYGFDKANEDVKAFLAYALQPSDSPTIGADSDSASTLSAPQTPYTRPTFPAPQLQPNAEPPSRHIRDGDTLRVVNVSQNDPNQLNVRAGPGEAYKPIGWIPCNGSRIVYLGRKARNENDLWVYVRWGDVIGWVHSSYLDSDQ